MDQKENEDEDEAINEELLEQYMEEEKKKIDEEIHNDNLNYESRQKPEYVMKKIQERLTKCIDEPMNPFKYHPKYGD